jgi:aminocarboxymuconate-semialdehyde decarboxylase
VSPVVDVHTHLFPEITRAESRLLDNTDGPWLKVGLGGTGMIMKGDGEFRPVEQCLWDPAVRIAEMDDLGVDVQVVSSTPVMFGYDAEPERAAGWCELVNARILEFCSYAPDRLVPLCQVPLQNAELAADAMSRALENGHRGVHIGNHIGPRELDDEHVVEFLTHCADHDAAVLVHPWDMLGPERTGRYMLAWLVGMAAETHLSILSLALSGAFERLPDTLKLLFAHGGGSFPYLLGRADNAWHRRDLVRADSTRPPSAYVDRFSVDSAVFDGHALRLLTEVMGTDRVLLGSDYPYPLGEEQVGSLVRTADHLDQEQRDAVLGGNALAFFGLEKNS